jgi:hypothetical protein
MSDFCGWYIVPSVPGGAIARMAADGENDYRKNRIPRSCGDRHHLINAMVTPG